jgi:hypothetical protein
MEFTTQTGGDMTTDDNMVEVIDFTDSLIEKIDASYDNGDSLETMFSKVGTDEKALHWIHLRVGVAKSTLQRRAAAWRVEAK